MSASASDVRRLVHYSRLPIESWGKFQENPSNPKNTLENIQKRTAFLTGKPKGIWYGYEEDWHTIAKPMINASNMSQKNKNSAFNYKYLFKIPENQFTKELDTEALDANQILVLSLDNFKDFLIRYNAPGIGRPLWNNGRPLRDWIYVWHGLKDPKATYDGIPFFGVDSYYSGIEFSQDLVDIGRKFKGEDIEIEIPEGFKIIEKANHLSHPKIIYEFDFTESDGTSRHVAVDVSFLRYLDLRSGCFFSPQTLFPNPPSHYLVSSPVAVAGATTGSAAAGTARRGGRRTRRGKLIAGRIPASGRRRGYRTQ